MKFKSTLMNKEDMLRALKRISHQIIERNSGAQNLVLLGIKRRGLPIAHILAENIKSIEGVEVPVGELDITFYRDDLSPDTVRSKEPLLTPVANEDMDIEGRDVILVDDVIFTGRTVRCALDACNRYGRAKTIQLACLIDRGHRELPIRADYIGKNIPTSKSELIAVKVRDIDKEFKVELYEI